MCSQTVARSSCSRALLSVVCGLLVYLLTVSSCRAGQYARDVTRAERLYWIRQVYRPLAAYAEEHGPLPASPKGPEAALYKLRPYVTELDEILQRLARGSGKLSVQFFDIPYTRLRNGPATWDESAGVVRNIDYDYLNETKPLKRGPDRYALYAEKDGSSPGGRWVVFSDGAPMWVSERNKLYREPLGRSWKELREAEGERLFPVKLEIADGGFPGWPYGKPRARWQRAAIRDRMETLTMGAFQFTAEHKTIPYSERGPEYALYELRETLPDAAVFDAPYSGLQNGAAWWNHEERRLENGDYIYLNEPLTAEEAVGLCLFAEKWGASWRGARWVGIFPASARRLWRGDAGAAAPLGKRREELR